MNAHSTTSVRGTFFLTRTPIRRTDMALRWTAVRLAAAPSRHLAPAYASSLGVSRAAQGCSSCRQYSSAAEDPAPPLLAKLKGDLKSAMKNKDKARLAVLRSVLAATLNASKTAQPINTDAKLVALLRKTARSSQEAVDEFRGAGRGDLAEKEEEQIQILEGYAQDSGIVSLSTEELQATVEAVLAELAAENGAKAKAGDAMKRLLAPGGPLDGKDFNKGDVAKMVKALTS